MWVVGFDSHNMTVIAADFVPIVPYSTESLNIAIGQRYDVIVEMNQPIGSYYVRAVAQTGCPSGGANTGLGTTNAIMNYVGSNSTPVTNTPITNVTAAGCIDEPLESLVPYVALPAGTSSAFSASASTIPAGLVNTISTADDGVVNKWYINNGYMNVNYSQPTLSTLDDSLNQTLISNPVILSTANTWVYFIIQNQFFASHPMHIHGHDVSVLGTGSSPWDNSLVDTLNFVNPTRRDTVMLQGSTNPANPAGYTVIGFETDNPGAWLMHCHIIWHVDDGLSLQFIERPDDIVSQGYSSKPTYEAECSALEAYAAGNPQSVKTDGESGLKRRTSSPERSTLEKLAARHVKAGDMKRDHLRHGQIRKRFAPHHHAH
jgi:FtsP/CotA-like multicopper oxidase with cupredoxin domain